MEPIEKHKYDDPLFITAVIAAFIGDIAILFGGLVGIALLPLAGLGLVPIALGSQTAGSILRPAAYNGVVGFKPTYGRISKRGVFPLAWSLDHVGLLARSVEDCGLFLAAVAGHDPADPSCMIARP